MTFERKPVPTKIQAEIDARARNSKQNALWVAKRFPWIHVMTMCEQCDPFYVELTSLQHRIVVGPGSAIDPTNPLYEDNYVRPKPNIAELQIKKQGELGTTKRATIKILAFTDDQLVKLQQCYFIPGMSVRLQFGWTVDIFNQAPPPLVLDRTLTDTVATKAMRKLAQAYPCYDGLQGMVANFSYSLAANNIWECSIEIIAAAEAFANSSTDAKKCEGDPCTVSLPSAEDPEKKTQVQRSYLWNALYELADECEAGGLGSGNAIGPVATKRKGELKKIASAMQIDPESIYIETWQYEGTKRDPADGSDSHGFQSFFTDTLGAGTEESFISWAAFEVLINTLCIPSKDNKTWPIGSISSNGTYLTHHPSLESSDPRICFIPGTEILTGDYDCGLLDSPSDVNVKRLKSAIVEIDGTKLVKLSDIRVNTIMLIKELNAVENGDHKLSTLLTNVLKNINKAVGDLWDLSIASEDEDAISPRIAIVDAKFPGQKRLTEPAYSLPASPFENQGRISVLRDMKLDMKMTDGMKTQALYSNAGPSGNTGAKEFGPCGKEFFKPFGLSKPGVLTNMAVGLPPKLEPCPKCDPDAQEEPTKLSDLMEFPDSISDAACESVAIKLKELYTKPPTAAEEEAAHCVGTPLPFEFSFTLDGIGGIGFGQIVTCDRIPQAIREGFEWQVTTAEHNVTPNDWSTTVNTIARTIPQKA